MTQQKNHRIDVQWGDMDALGHVNNQVYLRMKLLFTPIPFFFLLFVGWAQDSRSNFMQKHALFGSYPRSF
jgi:Acyl-ACP thioesterase